MTIAIFTLLTAPRMLYVWHNWYRYLVAIWYPNQNTPGGKTVVAKNLKRPCWKDWNQSGWPTPPDVDGIKIFDNDNQAIKHYCCLPTAQSWWQAKVMFCGLLIIIKILIQSTAGGLGCPFWFLFSMAFFRFLATTFFALGVCWLGFHFFFLIPLLLFSFLAKILLCNNVISIDK